MRTDDRRRTSLLIICILLVVIVIGAYVIGGDAGLPDRDAASEAILQNHVEETGARNAVTAIYLNYRLWDTLFEAMVLLLSAIAVISFSWSHDDETKL